ncbi:signal recognition particle-docking protein FtsY [Desulforhopalus sp. IMCC35007]|uniref:signal recognition particle-docking protein FtsY n=1 Tax=Desulforhopalus sp. IMCC35007 TaxID=2569543 RepID=UPI0010AECB9A|nr:signal recognition particle-docking protein FtsY [Desulforhopalus sp. IMCC35007]TKB09403.1 signal recognition particle-docking protein FtsY [Desulforhopalus sp. IMCC35007]
MLGWFKKKFGKKETPSVPDVPSIEHEGGPQPDELPAEIETSKPSPPASLQEDAARVDSTPSTESTEQLDQDKAKDTVDRTPTPSREETVLPKKDIIESAKKEDVDVSEPESLPEILTQEVEAKVIADEPEPLQSLEPLEAAEPVAEATDVVEIQDKHEEKVKPKKESSLFARLTNRLGKSRETFTYQMDALFLGKKQIDSNLLDSLEEILITADLGVETSVELIDYARKKVKRKELSDPSALKGILKEQIKKYILANDEDATLVMPKSGPFVIMVVGVNGVGKTTTIGKIAHKFKKSGQSVMLVAADTFRAAAVSQLKIWGERNGVPVIAHKDGADPSSVVFDALTSAVANQVDVVIVDTAGRMHTKDNLMEELKKIKRVISKKMRGAPHEVMLVIDATTGQNGISQARLFDAAVDVTGLTLTKLDGTSKGGIVANICRDMKIPIRFIGIGEQMDDLRDFDANEFVDALFHSEK